MRVSDIVGMPVTFGSTILLPRECAEWDHTKCQAVLTHERAHIAHGDFYILLLAMLNRALFWFSPFAWWQVKRLAELAEMISDDAAIEVLADRPSYADILIEFAGDAPRAPAGLAMARANTVRPRVERILAAKGLPVRAGWQQQVLIRRGPGSLHGNLRRHDRPRHRTGRCSCKYRGNRSSSLRGLVSAQSAACDRGDARRRAPVRPGDRRSAV